MAFDESGNTGSDLVNDQQPVLTTCAVRISDEQAQGVLEPHVEKVAAETQFSRLRRSAEGRSAIIEILNDARVPQATKVSSAHKRTLMYAYLVDVLLVPVFKDRNVDMWREGLNILTREALRNQVPDEAGADREAEWLDRFRTMCRTRLLDATEAFYSATRHLVRAAETESLTQMLKWVLESRSFVGSQLHEMSKHSLDPSVSNFVALVNLWAEELGGQFTVRHDRSNVMQESREFLEQLCDQSRPKTMVGHGDRTLRLPLPVSSIEFVDSSLHPSVQLADLAASGVAYWSRSRMRQEIHDSFVDDLEQVCRPLVAHVIWPKSDLDIDELRVEGSSNLHPDDAVEKFLEP